MTDILGPRKVTATVVAKFEAMACPAGLSGKSYIYYQINVLASNPVNTREFTIGKSLKADL